MLYRTLKAHIINGIDKGALDVADITEKLDVFWTVGKLTKAQYEELSAMVKAYAE